MRDELSRKLQIYLNSIAMTMFIDYVELIAEDEELMSMDWINEPITS